MKAKIKLNRFIRKKLHPKPKEKPFSLKVKEGVKKIQGYRCAHCRKQWNEKSMDFDHIRGNYNNQAQNCQWLCVVCHRRKTRHDLYKKKLDTKLGTNDNS